MASHTPSSAPGPAVPAKPKRWSSGGSFRQRLNRAERLGIMAGDLAVADWARRLNPVAMGPPPFKANTVTEFAQSLVEHGHHFALAYPSVVVGVSLAGAAYNGLRLAAAMKAKGPSGRTR